MSEKNIEHLNISSEIVEIGKRLYEKNLLAAADGNISFRLTDDEILITASGVSKAFMKAEQMALINLKGEILFGNPSTEKLMHLQIYQSCPEARAVVHAHPPTAIGFTVAHPSKKELPDRCLSEVILACGSIPVAPYAEPGSHEMADVLKPFLPISRAIILARHGAITWGESLDEAWKGMERIEHSAQILLNAQNWGGLTELESHQVERLKVLRQKIGNRLL